MLQGDDLAHALEGCQRSTLKATLYRYVNLEYLATLTSAIGGKRTDNRYTPKDLTEVYYAASAPDLAMLEATRHLQREFTTPNFPSHAIMPITVKLSNVLDLVDEDLYGCLETSFMELTGDWRNAHKRGQRVVTQELGVAAFKNGFSAIRYPSAFRGDEWNAALFPDNIGAHDAIMLDLPPVVKESMIFLTELEEVRREGVTGKKKQRKIQLPGAEITIKQTTLKP